MHCLFVVVRPKHVLSCPTLKRDEERREREKRRKGTERRDAFCGGQEAGERWGQAVAGERGPPMGDLEHSMDASQKRTAVDVEASCADDGNSKET